MAIVDVVKWDGAPNVFAFKFPNTQLKNNSHLIVSESQEAVFAKEGLFYGPFGPGSHVLESKNYPFLTKFVSATISGGAPLYTAEVWFTNKAIPLNIKWGTTDAIQVEDPKYHIMLPVRAFGQYGIQISNSQKFLAKMVGQLPVFVEMTMREYFRGFIVTRVKDAIAKFLVDQDVSILQISSKLNDISQALENKLCDDLEEYGVRITAFMVNSISTDESDSAVQQLKKALAKKAEMNIIGYTYQQEKSFDVLGQAAGNTGAGGQVMGAGIGMGMGVGIGAPLGNLAAGLTQNIRQTAPSCKCPKCGGEMPLAARFCPNCGFDKTSAAAESAHCPKCGAEVKKNSKFCPECGARIARVCCNCGKAVPENTKFCPECGSKID